MKRIAVILGLFLAVFTGALSQAGEFSKIDQEVKREVIEAYSYAVDGDIYPLAPEDISDLERMTCNFVGWDCDLVVQGLAKNPHPSSGNIESFLVCIIKDVNGDYEGEIMGIYERDAIDASLCSKDPQ